MSYTLLTAFVLVSTVWIVNHIRFCLSFPSAPGPVSGRWGKLWYLRKIWQGKFEQFDIEAHDGGGEYFPPSKQTFTFTNRPAARKVVRIAPQMYSIDDPTMVRAIYGVSSPFPKSKWYDAFGDPRVPNHNLFSARDRVVHGVMRRKVANIYAMSTIKSYEPRVDSCIDLLLQRLDDFAGSGQVFDLSVYLRCYAFDVIGAITVSLSQHNDKVSAPS